MFYRFPRFLILSFLLTALSSEMGSASVPEKPYTTKLANGFDFPVGYPNAEEYYKSRGFRQGGHLGEDWLIDRENGTSLGKSVYNVSHGVVLLARDVHVAWGNVIVIRHAYLEKGQVCFTDSLYAHLDRIDVKEGATVERGQKIGTIGNNHGMYPSHLHFELHKNLNIGVNHTGFAKTSLNYWIPTDFIVKHRTLSGNNRTVLLPVTHFDIPSPFSYFSKRHRVAHTKKVAKKKKSTTSKKF